jgi:hypothetical protein
MIKTLYTTGTTYFAILLFNDAVIYSTSVLPWRASPYSHAVHGGAGDRKHYRPLFVNEVVSVQYLVYLVTGQPAFPSGLPLTSPPT